MKILLVSSSGLYNLLMKKNKIKKKAKDINAINPHIIINIHIGIFLSSSISVKLWSIIFKFKPKSPLFLHIKYKVIIPIAVKAIKDTMEITEQTIPKQKPGKFLILNIILKTIGKTKAIIIRIIAIIRGGTSIYLLKFFINLIKVIRNY